MLDVAAAFSIPTAPDIDLYPDRASPTRYYAIPRSPRIARGPDGQPLVSLLLYGRGQGAQRRLLGGQLTLTTSLALTPTEEQSIREGLAARVAEAGSDAAPGDNVPSAVAPPKPESFDLVSPAWLDGTVEVSVGDDVTLTGKPSLLGANECAMSAELSADQASATRRAWKNGPLSLRISYHLQATAATTETSAYSRGETGSVATPGHSRDWLDRLDVSAERSAAVAWPTTIEGSVSLASNELDRSVQEI